MPKKQQNDDRKAVIRERRERLAQLRGEMQAAKQDARPRRTEPGTTEEVEQPETQGTDGTQQEQPKVAKKSARKSSKRS